MVCENFPNLAKVTFICNRTKSKEEFQKSVLQNFRAQRPKEGTLAQAALWTSGHKTRLICLKFSMSFHSWWGRKRLWALSFVWNLKKKIVFLQSCSSCPLCFSWAASLFPTTCRRKCVGHIQTVAVPGTFKFGEDHTPRSLSWVSLYRWNTDRFQSGSLGFLGDEAVMWWDFPYYFSTFWDQILHSSFLSLEWVATKQRAAASRKRLHLVAISVVVTMLSTESFRNLTQNQKNNLLASVPKEKGDA